MSSFDEISYVLPTATTDIQYLRIQLCVNFGKTPLCQLTMTGVHHFYHYPPTESLWLSCIFKKSHIYLLLFAILRYSLCFLFLYFTMPMTVLRPYILFACPIIPSHDIIFSITGSVYYSFRRVCRYLQTTVKPNIFSVRTPLPPANHTERFLIFFTLLFIKCLPISR